MEPGGITVPKGQREPMAQAAVAGEGPPAGLFRKDLIPRASFLRTTMNYSETEACS